MMTAQVFFTRRPCFLSLSNLNFVIIQSFFQKARRCECVADAVHIDMSIFVKKYMPETWANMQEEARKHELSSDDDDDQSGDDEDDDDAEVEDDDNADVDVKEKRAPRPRKPVSRYDLATSFRNAIRPQYYSHVNFGIRFYIYS